MEEKNYIFNINETQFGFVQVKAKNKEEAKEKAHEKYDDGGVIWTNAEAEVVSIEEK